MFWNTELILCPIGLSAASDETTFIFSVVICSFVGGVASGCFFEMTERSIIVDKPHFACHKRQPRADSDQRPERFHGLSESPFHKPVPS